MRNRYNIKVLGGFAILSAWALATLACGGKTVSPTAPSITTQPTSTTAIPGGAAAFTVTAAGTGPLAYQWSQGGQAITGATCATYTPATQLADSGEVFTVTVTNAQGSVTSSAATLTVAPAAFTLMAGSVSAMGTMDGDGTMANFNGPQAAAVYAADSLYLADTGNNLIRSATIAQGVATITTPTFGQAAFSRPMGIAVDGCGNLYVADTSHNLIRKILSADGTLSTLAGGGGSGSAGSGFLDGQGGLAAFNEPMALAVDSVGNLYVCDNGNYAIRKITPGGLVSTVAGGNGNAYVDGAGTQAAFSSLGGIALDSAGDLLVADTGNQVIRKVATRNLMASTVAGTAKAGQPYFLQTVPVDGTGLAAVFNVPTALVMDAAGNLYILDYNTAGNLIVRILTPAGVVTTVAGFIDPTVQAQGPNGLSPVIMTPGSGMTVDRASGTIYVVAPNALFSLGPIAQTAP